MLHRARFFSSWLGKTRTFPYEFGRTKYTQDNGKSVQWEFLLKKMFSEDVFTGFSHAYRNLLEAIYDKDLEFLRSNLEANLTKDLEIPDLQLINPDSPIQHRVTEIGIVIGAQFDRAATPNSGKQKTQPMGEGIKVQFFLNPLNLFTSINQSPILWTNIEFSSAEKLVRKGTAPDTSQERHIIRFETSSPPKPFDISQIMGLMRSFGQPQVRHEPEKMLMHLIGKDYSWKVADIDEHLKGNPW